MGDPTVATPFGTRFSIPFLLAARLAAAEPILGEDAAAAFARADVHELARRTHVIEDPEATNAYPARQQSYLQMTLSDGLQFSASAGFIRGEAERPHSNATLEAKFLTLTRPSWGNSAAEALRALRAIEDANSITDLTAGWTTAVR